MDDCGDYEVLPGVPETASYETRVQAQHHIDKFVGAYELTKFGYWKIRDIEREYFESIYSPYVCLEADGTMELADQTFSYLATLNIHCLFLGRRVPILLIGMEDAGEELIISTDNTLVELHNVPIVNLKGQQYTKLDGACEVKSVSVDQTIQTCYEGNILEWGNIPSNTAKPVTSLDVFYRLLYTIDFCSHIDFYLWMNTTVESWNTWPEVKYAPIEISKADIQNNKPPYIEALMREYQLEEGAPGLFKRHNLYLGCLKELVPSATPFYSEVSNGVFTLHKSWFEEESSSTEK